MELVRKGALAREKTKRDPAVARACDSLARLADFGALGGITDLIGERLRQVEQMNWTPGHDALLPENQLLSMIIHRVGLVMDNREFGGAILPDDAGEDVALREAGAMIAAELDRLGFLSAREAT